MTVIHANDPTTRILSRLYEQREDITVRVTETCTNGAIQRAIREDNIIMMLGHGNQYGLFSAPDKNGNYRRFLVTDRHVQFLHGKTCIGIWCYANKFAERYGLHGLFSGMIISEFQEAIDYKITATKDEINSEMGTFVKHLENCLNRFELHEVPIRIKDMDDVKSELTIFNYNNLYYYE